MSADRTRKLQMRFAENPPSQWPELFLSFTHLVRLLPCQRLRVFVHIELSFALGRKLGITC